MPIRLHKESIAIPELSADLPIVLVDLKVGRRLR